MLLSSTAEQLYWSARYFERAQALARVVRGFGRLSLDLPSADALAFAPLVALVGGSDAGLEPRTDAEILARLVTDVNNPSSVAGALERARENLRSSRIITPPAIWAAVNALRALLAEVNAQSVTTLFAALEAVTRTGSEVEGELAGLMTRDDAYSFWRIGSELERADMLLRSLEVLVPTLLGAERHAFDDVRCLGLLDCVGAQPMYRRRFHVCRDRKHLLEFLLRDASYPRSVRHAALVIERELDRLPRPGAAANALRTLRFAELVPAPSPTGEQDDATKTAESVIAPMLLALDHFAATFSATYFPAERPAAPPAQATSRQAPSAAEDPFAQLGREHAAMVGVLELLEEFAAHAFCGDDVERDDLRAVMNFFGDYGVADHHEKEESILMPVLISEGFSWYDGPLSAMRREHRHEQYFVRVLSHLAAQSEPWSSEDRRQFASVAREFTQFLREHMRREQTEVFEPASRRLSPQRRAALLAEFAKLDASAGASLAVASARLATLRRKYRMALRATA